MEQDIPNWIHGGNDPIIMFNPMEEWAITVSNMKSDGRKRDIPRSRINQEKPKKPEVMILKSVSPAQMLKFQGRRSRRRVRDIGGGLWSLYCCSFTLPRKAGRMLSPSPRFWRLASWQLWTCKVRIHISASLVRCSKMDCIWRWNWPFDLLSLLSFWWAKLWLLYTSFLIYNIYF